MNIKQWIKNFTKVKLMKFERKMQKLLDEKEEELQDEKMINQRIVSIRKTSRRTY